MTDSVSSDDSPEDLWLSRLDAYLTAIQQGDIEAQKTLLRLEPNLAAWTDPLCEIDDFARLFRETPSPFAGHAETIDVSPDKIQFGKYELRGELGRGGMGVVFQAYQPDLDRSVALKMLTSHAFATPDQRRRFIQEARLASRIRHPQIVTIHEVGEFGGQPYFTMELISGTSLAARLQDGPMPIESSVRFLVLVAKAVEHLHANGVVHRDLKPSNILIDCAGHPCLVDFGLAKSLDEFHDPTITGTILGTPSYMSPEQAAGRVREVDARSDVYSLGAILYEILSGRPPFQSGSSFDTVLQVLEREPLPLRHWNPAIPKNLEQICLRCLEKSPDARYQTAQKLAEGLESWLQGDFHSVARQPAVFRLVRTIRRHPAAGYRLLGLLPTLLIVVLRCCVASEYWSYYAPIIAELSLWAGLSLVWEWLSHSPRGTLWTPDAFVLTDLVFLTAILQMRQAADISHVTAYVLVVLMAGLTLNRRLIWVAGLGSVAGYFYLASQGEGFGDWHVLLIMVVLLACCTLVTDYQVRRLSIWIRPKLNGPTEN